MKVAIIGGGISALATAFYLKKERPQWEVTVFEKEAQLGGKMKTVNQNGFLFEEGSNGFLSSKPDTLALVSESGCEALLMPSNDNARIRFIFKDALHRLPESPMAFLATPLLSWREKLRVAMEFFTPAQKEETDETLQSFGYRRVGKGMTDTFLDAMVAGIFASTPEKISVKAAFPAVVRLEKEYGGLFRGMLAKKKKEAGPGGILMSFAGGVSRFIEKLAEASGARIELEADIREIASEGSLWRIKSGDETLLFDKVVLATPAYESARYLRTIDPEAAALLDQIEYSPVSVVGLGYEHLSHDLLGFGLLTTTSAQQEILGVLWDSSIFTDRAPKGKKSVRVMIGGQRNAELALQEDAALIAMAKRGIMATMGVADEPTEIYVKRYEQGIPNYPVGHLAAMDKLFARIGTHHALYLNSNAYRGVGLNDCVANSKQCARSIVKQSEKAH